MIKFTGYDKAIIGPALVWSSDGNRVDRLVYDAEAIRKILMSQDGMTAEDAREYIEFNMEGGYVGPDTPVIVWPEDDYSFDE
jgi:hypothetical protein